MQVYFRQPGGETISLHTNSSCSIQELKEQINSVTQIPIDCQRLNFCAKELEEGSLEENNVLDGCFVELNLRLLGGAMASEMPDHLKQLASKYRVDKMICRKCYARLPLKAYNCRKRKCGHCPNIRPKKKIKDKERK